ncbi:MAG: L-threonylcarbamoyladenylate synthase [Gammaproteobacteria bacterium]|nr:L-threonylcarbamoyladenylate synthase [Gammaproteobacteria bacterium]
MYSNDKWKIRQACHVMKTGGIIAYPTEAVYGLGCDPLNADAVHRLLAMKQRPIDKGLILVAANLQQLKPYIQSLTEEQLQCVQQSWPGPTTWIVPARLNVPVWIRGHHTSLAVRVSAHPVVQALCKTFGGPIISTSANRSGMPPARSALQVRRGFIVPVDYTLHAPLGGADKPTEIRDLRSGKVVRSS